MCSGKHHIEKREGEGGGWLVVKEAGMTADKQVFTETVFVPVKI